jgi:predicted nucleic acid-binding protein
MYLQALDIYSTNPLDFADAVILAKMKADGIKTVISFDTDFDRVPGIERREPEPIKEQAA